MKKSALTTICILATTLAAFGQGTVNWALLNPGFITTQTNSTQYSPLFMGGSTGGGTQGATAAASGAPQFYFALLYTSYSGSHAVAPTTLEDLATWQDTGLMATNSVIAGRLAPINGDTAATVPWASGVTNSIMLAGWSANLGSTWTAALNGLPSYSSLGSPAYFGTSATGYISPSSVNPGANVFGSDPNVSGLPINSLNTQLYLLPLYLPVPEPGTWALLGLGSAVLLVWRRKR